jgi:hypothetical protein
MSIRDGFREYDKAEKKVLVMFNIFTRFPFRIDIRIDPVLTALNRITPQCKTALTLVVYRIILLAMGCDKVLHPGR